MEKHRDENSPFDVSGVQSRLTAQEILDAVKESRERTRLKQREIFELFGNFPADEGYEYKKGRK